MFFIVGVLQSTFRDTSRRLTGGEPVSGTYHPFSPILNEFVLVKQDHSIQKMDPE